MSGLAPHSGRRVLRAGDRALLVEEADLDAATRLHAALSDAALPGVTELVPAARTVLVRFEPAIVSARDLGDRLRAVEPADATARDGRAVVLRVRYDGEDLEEAAAALRVSPEELAARHAAASWRVAFTGFAPGFGYLIGDDPLFDVPRRASPRTRVPAGAVALAGPYSGVYPREMPGGWQVIGRTDAVMWDALRDPPALLAPGAVVRFERVERLSVTGAAPGAVGRSADARYAVEVISPGVQLTVQDRGRAGRAALGVAASGAADRRALRAANEAVGNSPSAAALEVAGGGAVLRLRGAGVVAVAGARMDAVLTRSDGTVRMLERGVPAAAGDGDVLELGPAQEGLRAVVAVRGGIDAEPVLGSLSIDTLAGLGPFGGAPLAAGSVIPLRGPAAVRAAVLPGPAAPVRLPRPGDVVELRVVPGPRDDWFTPAAARALGEREWLVTPRADRVGVRLQAEPGDGAPLERAVTRELPSEAAVPGAVQVPPDGHPVLFLRDHPVTGGYPVIAVVADADLDVAGQLPPGARVRFRPA
ncbi:5-oxoprolinase/urea amidolyase family protein [Microbacterium album]|uniref:Allophanate hydrolase n=1 Tax=Microbacterium album TaxID=2053191 RepID=A0A917IC76_9MICO|nr:5-oxoprolinase/urea amidolyase family protein [Microbacterium album]GGH34622.1 allophanate hydrolase [Microbacterium album]